MNPWWLCHQRRGNRLSAWWGPGLIISWLLTDSFPCHGSAVSCQISVAANGRWLPEKVNPFRTKCPEDGVPIPFPCCKMPLTLKLTSSTDHQGAITWRPHRGSRRVAVLKAIRSFRPIRLSPPGTRHRAALIKSRPGPRVHLISRSEDHFCLVLDFDQRFRQCASARKRFQWG